jgi:predicted MFS family arabinose efflux permease
VSATLAAIVAAPVSGVLLKAYGFRPVIFLYAGLQLFSAFITLGIDLQFKKPAQKIIQNLKDVLSQVEILIFFLAMLWAGEYFQYIMCNTHERLC